MVDLYVYYKVRAENAARLAPLVRAMQARLVLQHGVTAQLKRRPEAKDGIETWMEVYPAASAALRTALAGAEHEAGIAGLIEGSRHTEVFTDLTSCA